ncbi:Porphobilinogen deaminase [Cryptotermes secundus]|uniref:hydroxymethylbilane synthase n=1 Tax=Cryptotermes secundus TaxID=105785 RepID=A0A2J7RE79_9NEOP|nr:porphobilinogen deaminase [Cryptotermes secundus]PNF39142.1 Porphobilinogen deaminase [Cryptotermes secundus]PNF39143.1 Porphobilinogen deaminase [Cryptotermes secundus]
MLTGANQFFKHAVPEKKENIRIGSRRSQLALIQTRYVIECLKNLNPEKTYEIVEMSTMGDQILNKALPKIGEKSLFTKELEIALEQQDVDFVVHSLKDLPTTLPDGLCIGAILKREDPRDALVLHPKHEGKTLKSLPKGSVIGTSSLRRTAQLNRSYPELKVENIRGNLNTRLNKLDNGETYAAVVLASAGLSRMGWEKRISQKLEAEELLYAVGQGALAIECREDDFATLRLLEPLFHGTTTFRVLAERSFLRTLGGGCSAPVAVKSELIGQTLSLTGAVWSLDGNKMLRHSSLCRLQYKEEDEDGEPPRKCPYRMPKLFCSISPGNLTYRDLEEAEKLGEDLACHLVNEGALDIMKEAKKQNESS